MRISIAVLLGGFIACTARAAWGQVPGQVPEAVPGPTWPSAPPGPPAFPPPAWPPPGPPQPPAFAPPMPPPVPQQAFSPAPPLVTPPQEAPPLKLARRVGFGIGLWAAPGIAAAAPVESPGGVLGSAGAPFGSSLGIRAWASERIVLLPALRLSISRTSSDGARFTNGLIATGLSLGYAAYRGKSTRVVLSGGLSFSYGVQGGWVFYDNGGNPSLFKGPLKTVSLAVPIGLALEQFFTPRISIVPSLETPVFSYSSSKVRSNAPAKTISADLQATRLGASLFFYTD